jgi:uncharacterized protein
MFLQADDSSATYLIQRYEPGKIWINQQCYQNSVIVWPHRFISDWGPTNFSEIKQEHFQVLFDSTPQIVLFGTGTRLVIPPQDLLLPLFEKGIGVELMDSRAACHTYTVLASEKRNVAACILII